MSLEKIEQHVELGLLKLAPAYWGKPRIGAGLASLLREIQTLEDVIWQQFELQHIETADRPRLVVIGKLIGQTPQGFSLEVFRTVIRARALANRSRGTGPDIGRVLVALVGAGNFAFIWAGPAVLNVTLLDAVDAEALSAAVAVLPFAPAAGVRLRLAYTEAGDGMRWGDAWGAPTTWFGARRL